jgi:uncharacterized metal-binding protein
MPSCSCPTKSANNGMTLIFACSGAADVGEVSDRAARQLAGNGAGKMYCLAGLGGQIEAYLQTTQAAARVLAIDGCPVECSRHVLENAGIRDFEHVQLAEIGLAKGHSPANEQNVGQVVAACMERLKA